MLSVDANGPITIDTNNKISIGYDGVSIINSNGKLASGMTVSQPLTLTKKTDGTGTELSLTYDSNTLALIDNALSAKQGVVVAGNGIELTQNVATS